MFRRFRELLQKKAVVLMYHRIAVPETDPWQLSVSPAHFEEQLQVLQAMGVSTEALAEQLASGRLRPGSICITFDDGYTDNFLSAKPLLEQYQCPATFFLATHFLNRQEIFWWDELENILLKYPSLPELFRITINGKELQRRLDHGGMLTQEEQAIHRQWVWPSPAATARIKLYLEVWEQLRPLPYPELSATMQAIRHWAGPGNPPAEADFPMRDEQVQSFLQHPLFTIGLHTATHPDLASHASGVQRQELLDCAASLRNNFGLEARCIAYPYGRYNADTLSVARELKLTAGFTTQGTFVTKATDRYQIPRFQVMNWNGETFARQLHQWSKTLF